MHFCGFIFVLVVVSGVPITENMLYEQVNDSQECLDHNVKHLEEICTYPGQHQPCLRGSELKANGLIEHSLNLIALAHKICEHPISQEELHSRYCCVSSKCLHLCYGIKRFYYFV
ncbi:hypothetical protein M3Y94_00004800 [Aphelenchoides besseyi]|nr:hypothetical protein M3Y94_00004800 [Aphelenchoides besseyi]